MGVIVGAGCVRIVVYDCVVVVVTIMNVGGNVSVGDVGVCG